MFIEHFVAIYPLPLLFIEHYCLLGISSLNRRWELQPGRMTAAIHSWRGCMCIHILYACIQSYIYIQLYMKDYLFKSIFFSSFDNYRRSLISFIWNLWFHSIWFSRRWINYNNYIYIYIHWYRAGTLISLGLGISIECGVINKLEA